MGKKYTPHKIRHLQSHLAALARLQNIELPKQPADMSVKELLVWIRMLKRNQKEEPIVITEEQKEEIGKRLWG